MADVKITALPAATTVATTDLSVVVVDPSTTPTTKKITIGDLATSLSIPAPATTVTDESTYGNSPVVGILTTYAREDHRHSTVPHDSHNSLTNVTANQHHNQVHTQGDHTGTGSVAELSNAAANAGAGTLPALIDHTHKKALNIDLAGSLVASRQTLNFVAGFGVTLAVIDDSGNDRVDATVATYNPYATTAINLTLDATHKIVKVTAPVTITLPTAVGSTGKDYIINATVDGVTVNTTSSQTVSGSLTWVLPANSSMSVYSDNANWQIF